MTRDQAILLLLSRLGQRQTDTVLQAAAVSEMNAAQERMEHEKFKPWFLLSEQKDVLTVAGEERLAVPSDFLEECEEGTLWRYDATLAQPYVDLKKDDYDNAKARYPNAGKPLRYSLSGNYFRLHPTPDAAYTIRSMFYVKQPVIPEAYGVPGLVTTNAWLTFASDWLIAETGLVLAKYYTRDTDAATHFGNDLVVARNRCHTETVARMEANYSRQMGED